MPVEILKISLNNTKMKINLICSLYWEEIRKHKVMFYKQNIYMLNIHARKLEGPKQSQKEEKWRGGTRKIGFGLCSDLFTDLNDDIKFTLLGKVGRFLDHKALSGVEKFFCWSRHSFSFIYLVVGSLTKWSLRVLDLFFFYIPSFFKLSYLLKLYKHVD